MKPGPRAKPTAIKQLRGVKPSRINLDEPKLDASDGACPEWLVDEAQEVWHTVAPMLIEHGLLSVVEEEQLAVYCTAVALHRQAAREVERDGLIVNGAMGGKVKNPALTVLREAATTIRQFAAEFGLTPSARQSIKVPTKKAAPGDDWFAENN
jgi:P27 family predicted phage terminase small subunit